MASRKTARKTSSKPTSPESDPPTSAGVAGTGKQPDKGLGQNEGRQGALMPLDYLLSIVRDESQDRPARVDAAKAAAPYCHARLSSLDHRGGLTLTHEQALEELD